MEEDNVTIDNEICNAYTAVCVFTKGASLAVDTFFCIHACLPQREPAHNSIESVSLGTRTRLSTTH